ncbi:hypothetical protein [Streptomyces broussonetiae]|uniref:Uncharacterized protein n=1 Tax=Streptomyces broussonetiae TaxID=2686304 RepID=A0A6I6NFW5_9ACTN|nr:hypothetical protein [Streptomyces broussonetiae]QHA09060.1 hypothetical protein GQF42_42805 [Streptomyces broussonetiae]
MVLEVVQRERDRVEVVGVRVLQSRVDHVVGPAELIARHHGGPGGPGQVACGDDQLPQNPGQVALVGDQHDRAQQRADPALGALYLVCGGQQVLHRLVEFKAGGVGEVQASWVRAGGRPGRRVRPARLSLSSRHDTCSKSGAIHHRA